MAFRQRKLLDNEQISAQSSVCRASGTDRRLIHYFPNRWRRLQIASGRKMPTQSSQQVQLQGQPIDGADP